MTKDSKLLLLALIVLSRCSFGNNAKNHPQLERRAGEGWPLPARPGRLTDSD